MIENILALLKKYSYGIKFHKMMQKLNISSKEKPLLKRKLQQLERTGLIYRMGGKYYLHRGTDVIKGKLISVVKDYAFVKPEHRDFNDIFIPPGKSGDAVLGDEVKLAYSYDRRKGKPEGRIIQVVKRARETLIGLYRKERGRAFFFPFDSPSKEGFPLKPASEQRLDDGVIIELDRSHNQLVRVLGKPEEPGVDLEVITRKYGLSTSFPPEVIKEAEGIKTEVSFDKRKGRMDFRDWVSMTIDGEDARDFDDAVSIKVLKKGRFLLGVHIADVSYYVTQGSPIDREAYSRGTSVYFPDLTLPMLPERLSNQICSLRPGEEKMTVSVVLEIDRNGEVVKKEFYRSMIVTKARLTYENVYKMFLGDQKVKKKYSHLLPDLMNMRELASILRKKRIESGSIDFEMAEPELVYKSGVLDAVVPFKPNEAHWLIEEFMLAANEAVAAFLSDFNIPVLYRVHPPPAKKDIERFREMLNYFGLSLSSQYPVKPKDIQSVLEQIKGRPDEKFITLEMLKSLQLAVYSPENTGHFGLGKKYYTHFTSPIRRYPDLIVHRILKGVLDGSEASFSSLASQAEHCSQRERNAEEAEKDLLEWRIYRILKNRLGEECSGFIIDISKSRLVIELDNYFVSGIMLYNEMKEDYYLKRDDKMISGRRTGKKFRLGEKLKVIIVSVNPESRKMILHRA
ncbi:MAG: ribonuclease R [Candidatus Aminicenantes bacterium]|nr:ribonuclease R [Candidatus Aminicenantes bacterium]